MATDVAGNTGTVIANRAFSINIATDTTPPTLTQITPVPSPTNTTTPQYTFSSNETGTISYSGDCSSLTTSALSGNNPVTFITLIP